METSCHKQVQFSLLDFRGLFFFCVCETRGLGSDICLDLNFILIFITRRVTLEIGLLGWASAFLHLPTLLLLMTQGHA